MARTYPEWLRKKLEEKGFFNTSPEQRAEAARKFLEALERVNLGNRRACAKALRELRGGGGSD